MSTSTELQKGEMKGGSSQHQINHSQYQTKGYGNNILKAAVIEAQKNSASSKKVEGVWDVNWDNDIDHSHSD